MYPMNCKDTKYTSNYDKQTYREIMPETNKKWFLHVLYLLTKREVARHDFINPIYAY